MTIPIAEQPFRRPGKSSGLFEVIRQPYLTSLIVHKELRIRYRGSALGMLWSYAKPAVQFLVFYFAIGVFMGMNRNIENYVIYMFSGVIAVNYFTEAFGNATRTLVWNAPLVKKIYLPRELFPMAALWVAVVHFVPQLLILLVGSLLFGWVPTPLGLLAVVVGFLIISVFSLGLGLIAGALNVFYRDAENFVDLILMLATWISPVLYKWSQVHEVLAGHFHGALWYLYQLNPMTVAVELFHYGFWQQTAAVATTEGVPHILEWTLIGILVTAIVLVIGEVYFRRADPRFAQEL